jgi:ribosomal protein S18 acetylase RimI-like enzyme
MSLGMKAPEQMRCHYYPDSKSLLRLIMKRSAHEGFRTMSLACELGNVAACELYRGQGFKEEMKVEYVWKTSEI